jgi:DNA-binding winged helix-turn-helix (wHTH) protein/Tfp pilus assembly protein PilF
MRYAFESYAFDASRLSLHRHGVLLPVKPKTAQVLAYFLRHPERLVTKNELMDELWPSEDVTEANLAQHVFLLRRIFAAHSPHESFIVTAARHGYRFVAPVRAVSDEAQVQSPAWKAYVRGRFFADQRTGESLRTALAAFEEALAIDWSFAAAHSGLASVQILRGQYLFADPSVFEGARVAAKTALSLDAQDVEGHLALAEIALFHDWDRSGALQEYDRALFLAPASTRVRVVRAWLFAIAQEHDRSLHEIEAGLRVEPFSLELLTTLGAIAWLRGAYESAREHCDYVLDLDPDYQLARYYRRAALAYGDEPGEALRAFDAEAPGVGYAQQSLSIAGFAAARAGDVARAETVLRALVEGDGFAYVSPVNIARVLAGLRRSADARAAIVQAIEQRDPWAIFVPGDAAFRSLRGIEPLLRQRVPPIDVR